ncbi:MAG: S8 family serine peptidase [Candidatus Zixiibacteriota bacterium]
MPGLNTVKNFLLSVLLTVLINQSGFAAEMPPVLKSNPVILEKPETVISERTREYIAAQTGDRVKIWVYFSDKQIFDRAGFDRAAADITLTERSLKRRAKVGRDQIIFADVPVASSYIDAVVELGAELRRCSKWLNAASFEVSKVQIDIIASLPFVVAVKPMAGYCVDEEKTAPSTASEMPDANYLNYGSSYVQLNQIKVTEVHELGYTGQGVTLAVFDSGFRKSHQAFAAHYNKNRVLGEWDFVFNDSNTANEAEDISNQWNHGTSTWGVAGGYVDGTLYGPAYMAYFLLAKTEDLRAEYQSEEDNWIAALEWADSAGADVVTSSVSYSDWYTYEDMDGLTAPITIAANTAAGLGIVLCNSIGNRGPAPGTLNAPADGFDLISVGAVSSLGIIATSSSRGPTYDDRTKPEVCAMGVNTFCPSAATDYSYGNASGTSYSTPLVAGAACLLIQARPTFPPEFIRTALLETASRADNPDNDYGWGIIDVRDALNWGVDFKADTVIGETPLTVNFEDDSTLSPTAWRWDFGFGDTSNLENPTHVFSTPGAYDISLAIQTAYGEITGFKENFIVALADTVKADSGEGMLYDTVVITVEAVNNIELDRIVLPVEYAGPVTLTYLGFSTAGCRTEAFENITFLDEDSAAGQLTLELEAGSADAIATGAGPIVKLQFMLSDGTTAGDANPVSLTGYETFLPLFSGEAAAFEPKIVSGKITYSGCCTGFTGNVNCSGGNPDISDITRLIDYLYLSHAPLCCLEEADVNISGGEPDISDITRLIDFLYISHAALPDCP